MVKIISFKDINSRMFPVQFGTVVIMVFSYISPVYAAACILQSAIIRKTKHIGNYDKQSEIRKFFIKVCFFIVVVGSCSNYVCLRYLIKLCIIVSSKDV
jgi:predicted membrane protein